MKFAYADPPYVGQAHRYGEAEVDHALLIALLDSQFPEGWALSCSVPSLRHLLPLCRPKARVLAWCKPFVALKMNVSPIHAWEPVILCGGRRPKFGWQRVPDFHIASCTLVREQKPAGSGFFGSKPESFCTWLFRAAGLEPSDEFVDIFPGSGSVGRAWEAWCRQRPLPFRDRRTA